MRLPRDPEYKDAFRGPMLLSFFMAAVFVAASVLGHRPWWLAVLSAAPWPALWIAGLFL